MINFRYHLVSLTAVFLALAAGITIGAGVVDRATVDQIERRLEDVDRRRQETNADNDRLRIELGRWTQFGEQTAGRTIEGRLNGATILLVGTVGVDGQIMESARDAMAAAGAAFDGTLWFTGKWTLAAEQDARRLAGLLDVAPNTRPEDLRAAALAAVTSAWAAGDSGPLVTSLLDAGFIEYDAPRTPTVPLAELPRPETLFVVVSGDGAEVPTAQLAEPFVDLLAAARLPVLAAQPVRPSAANVAGGPEPPPEFVVSLRRNAEIAGRISTIDNIDDVRGRVAAVLALGELRNGRTGHYGFGSNARIVPEPAPRPRPEPEPEQ